MFTPRLARSRSAFIALLMAFGLIAGSRPVLAQQAGDSSGCGSADKPSDPCFTTVTDILQGQRSLLPEDDLVMAFGQPNSDGSTNQHVVVNLTEYSQITSTAGPFEVAPTAAASASGVGRMFNLPRDVIVTATPGMVTIRDQGPPINVRAFPLTQTPVPHGMTLGDFNGDGYDDFVLAQTDRGNDDKWHGYLEFVTAEDPNDLTQGLNPGPYTAAEFPVGANDIGTASITSGDLDGDGIPEVIVAYPSGYSIVVNIYHFSRQDRTLKKVGTTTFNPTGIDDYPIARVVGVAST